MCEDQDTATAHLMCAPDGSYVCMAGWQDLSTDCTVRKLATQEICLQRVFNFYSVKWHFLCISHMCRGLPSNWRYLQHSRRVQVSGLALNEYYYCITVVTICNGCAFKKFYIALQRVCFVFFPPCIHWLSIAVSQAGLEICVTSVLWGKAVVSCVEMWWIARFMVYACTCSGSDTDI